MKYTTPYVAPTLTVDAVIFQVVESELHVLLLKRPHEPFQGEWALPGGYNPAGETTTMALGRILSQKTGISTERDLGHIEQLYTFDTVARDPRGHAVSVTYTGYGRDMQPAAASGALFVPVSTLPELAYDHGAIITYAHERLISKLSNTNGVRSFLPPTFTLAQLQSTYEAIFEHVFDKRNFRKKFLSFDLIHETGEMNRDGAHRPAKLYRFNTQAVEVLARSFE